MTSDLYLARNKRRRAFATLEYVMLVTILAIGLFTFRNYIERGFKGQYRKAGESFGFLRQYNPNASRDCSFDPELNFWYEQGCYNNQLIAGGCARKAPGTEYDNCIIAAKNACKLGCS